MAPPYALMKMSASLVLIHVIQMPSAGILLAVTSVTVVMMLVRIAHQVCTVVQIYSFQIRKIITRIEDSITEIFVKIKI